jgi:hypothetical protein
MKSLMCTQQTMLENVQCRFTKRCTGYRKQKLRSAFALLKNYVLENRWLYADMSFTYKCIHKLFDCVMSEWGYSSVMAILDDLKHICNNSITAMLNLLPC